MLPVLPLWTCLNDVWSLGATIYKLIYDRARQRLPRVLHSMASSWSCYTVNQVAGPA